MYFLECDFTCYLILTIILIIFWNWDFHKFLKGFLSPILSSTWKNVWKWSAKNKHVLKILLNLKDDILLEKYFLCVSIGLYISKQVISIPQPQEPFYPLNTNSHFQYFNFHSTLLLFPRNIYNQRMLKILTQLCWDKRSSIE